MHKVLLAVLGVFAATELPAATRQPFVAEAHIPGATLHIELLQPIDEAKATEIVEWLRAASTNVSRVYGRFPNPSPRVVVIPTKNARWGGDSAVSFGRVTRGGEERIEFYINPERPIEEFYDDWTATHEFSHLMLPLVRGRHKWISEGFASYYQNVLMSRAGRYTPLEAWQRLHAGFERGRASRPELSPNDAASSGVRRARMKIYWSGAAIALLADTALRERSGGKESLDVALGRLQHCCLPSRRTWSGPELFSRLDSLIAAPVFMPLYKRYANRAGFPDVGPILRRLGVEIDDDNARLVDSADLASMRNAISGRARQ